MENGLMGQWDEGLKGQWDDGMMGQCDYGLTGEDTINNQINLKTEASANGGICIFLRSESLQMIVLPQ